MRVLDLRTTRFRNLPDRTWDFAQGLQILRGPNEAGKSSLHQAILIALFANARSRDQTYVSARRWGESEAIAVTVRFQLGDGVYELIRDFEGRRNVLTLPGDRRITSADGIERELAARVPLCSEASFLATACVCQEELARVARSPADLFHLLEAHTLSGAGVNLQDLAEELTAHVSDLRRGLYRPSRNPGRLRQLRNDIDWLVEEATRIEARLAQVGQAADRLLDLEERLRDGENELATQKEHLRRHERCRELDRELKRAQETMQRAGAGLGRRHNLGGAVSQLEETIHALQQEVQSIEATVSIGRQRSNLRNQEAALRTDIARLERDLGELTNIEDRLIRHQQELLDLPLTRQDLESLKELPGEIQRLRRSIAEYEEQRVQEECRLQKAKEQLEHLDEAIPQVSTQVEHLARELSVARERRSIEQDLAGLVFQATELETQIAQVDSLEAQLKGIIERRAIYASLDGLDVSLLEQLPGQISTLEDALAGEGLEVSIQPLRAVELRIAVEQGGEVPRSFTQEEVLRAVERVRIVLDHFVALEVRNLSVGAQKLRELEATRNRLLRTTGCASWGELDEQIRARADAERECQRLSEELSRALGGKTREDLTKSIRKLQRRRADLKHRLSGLPSARTEEEVYNARLAGERELATKRALRQQTGQEIVERADWLAKDLAAGIREELRRKQRVYDELVARLGPEGPPAAAGVEARLLEIEVMQAEDRAAKAQLLGGRTAETIQELVDLTRVELEAVERQLGALGSPTEAEEGISILLARLESKRQDLEARDTELRNARAELALLDEATVRADYEQAALDAGIAQQQLLAIEEFRLTPDAVIAMESRIDEAETMVTSLIADRGAAREQAKEESGLQDRLAECRERIEAIVAQERFWHGRAKVDETIGALLSEARGKALSDLAKELPRSAGAILGAITAGQHHVIYAKDLNFELWSQGKQAVLTEDEFSRGTLDQFYLALRLACVRTLFPAERPPLLLDDPLVRCDPARRAALLELLRQHGEDGQVLLFTCHDFPEYKNHPTIIL